MSKHVVQYFIRATKLGNLARSMGSQVQYILLNHFTGQLVIAQKSATRAKQTEKISHQSPKIMLRISKMM